MKRQCELCEGEGHVKNHWRSWWEIWKPSRSRCVLCHGKGHYTTKDDGGSADDNDIDWIQEACDWWSELSSNHMFDSLAQQSQYEETIGLEEPATCYCFLANTESSKCITLLKHRCNCRYANPEVRPFQHSPADRNAIVMLSEKHALDHGGIPVPDEIVEKFNEAGRRGAAAGRILKNAMKEVTEMQGKRFLQMPGCPWPKPGDFRAAVDAGPQWPDEVKDLAKDLGITDEELEALRYQLLAVDVRQDCENQLVNPSKAADAMKRAMEKLAGKPRKVVSIPPADCFNLPKRDVDSGRWISDETQQQY
ncbi:hypothetical protein [Gimesia fumaroli]|uniref:Uncharacterized protein n=1 Tax=Gimesia fumaroli TaxID=2527976 RepID=A0A518I8X9_9PLAN|nr:hypothetical protein [Gimesia fumaroli]QDV49551.1 hypothetical protein Enr17x_15710 [Gimesia fumaroli]